MFLPPLVASYENELNPDAVALWQLLDDISTLSDIVKGDDAAFRRGALRLAEQRNKTFHSPDGYRLERTKAGG